ncbi:MATE efflux family protein [Chlamydia trachomatis]|nr:MATE efflux family protein [Chlamydia trachomatis]
MSIQTYIVEACIAKSTVSTSEVVNSYNQVRHQLILNAANKYMYFITGSIPIIMILNLLIFFLRAEGRSYFITFAALIANLFNIIFELIFFLVFKMDIIGGGISILIGYFVNILLVASFILFYEFVNKGDYPFSFAFKQLKEFKIN